jgi:hypothetical protein
MSLGCPRVISPTRPTSGATDLLQVLRSFRLLDRLLNKGSAVPYQPGQGLRTNGQALSIQSEKGLDFNVKGNRKNLYL